MAPPARRPAVGPATRTQAHVLRVATKSCQRAGVRIRRNKATFPAVKMAHDTASECHVATSPHRVQHRLSTALHVKAVSAEVAALHGTHVPKKFLCCLHLTLCLSPQGLNWRWLGIKARRAPWRGPTGCCTGSAACTCAAAPACAATGRPAYIAEGGSGLV